MLLGTSLTPAHGGARPLALNKISASLSGAWSFRRVNNRYHGAACRVRRSSDNAELDIPFTAAGNLDEAVLLSHVGAGSGYVTKVYDQSGNARDLAQATAAAQPLIVASGVINRFGTRPCMKTDGTDDTAATGAFAVAQPFTRLSVLQFLNPTPNTYLLNSAGEEYNTLYTNANQLLAYMGATVSVKTGLAANDKATVAEVANGASSTLSYNGTTASANVGTQALNGLRLASYNGTTAFCNANFAEVVIFPSALSSDARATWEADAKTYWGTP